VALRQPAALEWTAGQWPKPVGGRRWSPPLRAAAAPGEGRTRKRRCCGARKKQEGAAEQVKRHQKSSGSKQTKQVMMWTLFMFY
jgi:hypothetical protein